jgi:hypothetical protein
MIDANDIKNCYKNPNFYYILAPVVAVIWVLFLSTVSLSKADDKCTRRAKDYSEVQKLIPQILTIDPERLKYKVRQEASGEFDYSVALEEIAKLCGISSSNYSMTGGNAPSKGGKSRKTANVAIKTVDIVRLSRFLSQILDRWPDLECDVLTLTKLNTGKDDWKVSLKFTYTYK